KAEKFRRKTLFASLPWFEENLRPSDRSGRHEPPVQIFVMGANKWRNEQEWPLARTRYTSYYLHSGGKANSASGDGSLSTSAPAIDEPDDRYTYDPRSPVRTAGGAMIGDGQRVCRQNEIENRSDVLVYTTPPVSENTEVTGPVRATLYVSTTATNTDFTAKLVDVHPDGSAYNV